MISGQKAVVIAFSIPQPVALQIVAKARQDADGVLVVAQLPATLRIRFQYAESARLQLGQIFDEIELHINPSNVHRNPDGEKICGSHWHIYTEEYGRTYAFPAEDVQEDAFVDNTIAFLTKFNVVEQPNINYQLELL